MDFMDHLKWKNKSETKKDKPVLRSQVFPKTF